MRPRSGASGVAVSNSGTGTRRRHDSGDPGACRSRLPSPAVRFSRVIRIGVVGLGYWGPNLARNFDALADCELAWICDADPVAGERVAARFPSARFTSDLNDLLDDPRLDAVVLATPVPTHAALAQAVLEAGKDCFV